MVVYDIFILHQVLDETMLYTKLPLLCEVQSP